MLLLLMLFEFIWFIWYSRFEEQMKNYSININIFHSDFVSHLFHFSIFEWQYTKNIDSIVYGTTTREAR